MPLSAIVSILMVVLLVALAVEPDLRPFALFPASILMCSLIWLFHDVETSVQAAERRRFFGGLCAHCGYDLRAKPERCPECGSAIWLPEMPLARPGELWPNTRITFLVPEREVLEWMLERRGPTPDAAWGPDARSQAVAAMVIRACQQTSESAPYGSFRPCDPFAVLSSTTSVADFAETVRVELDLTMTAQELTAFEAMALAEVVDEICARSSVFPRMTWPRPRGVTLAVRALHSRTGIHRGDRESND